MFENDNAEVSALRYIFVSQIAYKYSLEPKTRPLALGNTLLINVKSL